MKNIISYSLLSLGVILLTLFTALILQRYNPNRLAFNTPILSKESKDISNLPMVISSSSFKHTLAIFPAKINGAIWETTSHGVSYLSSSALPGNKGNSVMYGHNWSSILGGLSKVKPLDTLTVIYQNGDKRTFRVQFVSIVTPDQTQILGPSDDARLTIYTCTGFLDSKRLVVTAVLVENVSQLSLGSSRNDENVLF